MLSNKEIVLQLSAQTLEHGDIKLWDKMRAELGTDPLRKDADFERLWNACCAPGTRGGNAPIGAVLMDQHKIAGVGNIYRAEILYKARVHPDQPAGSIGRPTLERVWHHTVDLMKRGGRAKFTADKDDLRRQVSCGCTPLSPAVRNFSVNKVRESVLVRRHVPTGGGTA